ncbi:hypothetical protein FNF27_01670 [Cafeteria roenbergensis]|uniref:WD repeat-containing protein 92 n=1 Tax=Cafeteria roenbergensis TaxID=33653 RepID=A0A5A8EI16_CAFRO|nr:hypothetical protein FNF27_01670 [Cafeteria roenbergensis]
MAAAAGTAPGPASDAAIAEPKSTMLTTEAPQIIEHCQLSITYSPTDIRWVPSSARFVATGEKPRGTGALQVYELDGGKAKLVHECEKPAAFKCATFGASLVEDRHLATGDYNGGLSVWDLNRTDAPVFAAPKAHSQIINCVDGCGGLGIGGGAPEIATCSRDGCVRIWDPRVPDPVVSLEPADGETARDCWTVAFGNSYSDAERCVLAGYDNGDVKLFDLRTNTLRWETNCGNGVVNVEFDRKDIEMNKIVATTLESRFRVFDARTLHPTEGFAFKEERAHKSTIWRARHLPQNRDLFATTGGNGGLNLYRYSYPSKRTFKDEEGHYRGVAGSVELLNSRVLSTQPMVSLDWSRDMIGLACAACLDQTLRVYIVTKLDKL